MIWQITVFLFFYFFIYYFYFWSLLWRKRKRIVGKFICTCVCVVFFLTKRVTLTAKNCIFNDNREKNVACCVRPILSTCFIRILCVNLNFYVFSHFLLFLFSLFVYFVFIIFAQKILHVTQVSLYIQSSIVVIIR